MFKNNRSEAAVLVKRWSLSGSIFNAAGVLIVSTTEKQTPCPERMQYWEKRIAFEFSIFFCPDLSFDPHASHPDQYWLEKDHYVHRLEGFKPLITAADAWKHMLWCQETLLGVNGSAGWL